MPGNFKVGEVAIYIGKGFQQWGINPGEECLITGGYQLYEVWVMQNRGYVSLSPENQFGYRIEFAQTDRVRNMRLFAFEWELRKKKPKHEPGEWDEDIFVPTVDKIPESAV